MKAQVNLRSDTLGGILDEQSAEMEIPKNEVAEILVGQGLRYKADMQKLRNEIKRLELDIEDVKTKAKFVGIDLDIPLAQATKQQAEQLRATEKMEETANKYHELLPEYELLQKKHKKLKKRFKKNEGGIGNSVNTLLKSSIEDGSIVQLASAFMIKGASVEPSQLSGVNNEEMEQAIQLHEFVKANFAGEGQKLQFILNHFANNKAAFHIYHTQITNQNPTKNASYGAK